MIKLLEGISALVTSGPTQEPIDPVRYISNYSSGRQGHAVAAALAELGANVTLVSGPVSLPDPPGVKTVHVQTAKEMLAACESSLPVDVAVCAAAVADWRAKRIAVQKIKRGGSKTATLVLIANPDILKTLSRRRKGRPKLVIGFAAETERLVKNAQAKREAKGCDWIVANDVSGGKGFHSGDNAVTLITKDSVEEWPRMYKQAVARWLAEKIAEYLKGNV